MLLGLRQRRLRKVEQVSNSPKNMSQPIEHHSEKYVKKLLGRTDLEDALKRLDKLTHEEARMATAEVLKVTHAVEERVKGVAEHVLGVDDRVAGLDQRVADVNNNVASVGERIVNVDNRVAGVDDKVANVDDRVANVDNRVRAVDKKVAVVIDGTQTTFSRQLQLSFHFPRRKPSQTFVIDTGAHC